MSWFQPHKCEDLLLFLLNYLNYLNLFFNNAEVLDCWLDSL